MAALMRLPTSPRDRRAVLAGGAIVGLALLVRGVPAGLHAVTALRARADAASLELSRSQELLAAERVLRDSLASRARRILALAPRLVAGATVSDARAELASIVGAAAARHRVRIAREEAQPDTPHDPFVRLVLRVEAEGDIAGVAGWLAELEEGPRLLTADELTIVAAEPTAPAAQPELLRVSLTIAGWAAPRGGS